MLRSFYRFLLYPALRTSLEVAALGNPKIKKGLELRRERPWESSVAPDSPPTVWFHVSSGEFEYAKPVIKRLKKKGARIVVTYFSPSVLKSLQSFPEVDFFCPTPWETQNDWQAFLRNQKPKALAIARTDVWPQMIWSAREAQIPILLFSTTLPSQSSRVSSPWGRFFYSRLLSGVSKISCVTEEDAQNVRRILAKTENQTEVTVEGDTRYDQVLERLAENRPLREELASFKSGRLTFVAGSTWEEDEEQILPALKSLNKDQWAIILVPHEPTPDHIENLKKQLLKLGLSSQLYSDKTLQPGKVLIVDKVGILADLYRFADLAFVGGSFRKTVHSVMEPNALGIPTLFGPYFQNNREAIQLEKLGLNKSLKNGQEISEVFTAESRLNDSDRKSRREKMRQFILSQSGVSEKTVEWIWSQVSKYVSHG